MSKLNVLKAAIRRTSNEYGCNGNHDSDLISNAFDRLLINLEAEELEAMLKDNPPLSKPESY